jgi:hypothetical protein
MTEEEQQTLCLKLLGGIGIGCAATTLLIGFDHSNVQDIESATQFLSVGVLSLCIAFIPTEDAVDDPKK